MLNFEEAKQLIILLKKGNKYVSVENGHIIVWDVFDVCMTIDISHIDNWGEMVETDSERVKKTNYPNKDQDMCEAGPGGNPFYNKKEYVHENGFRAILYGEKSMVILDPAGEEVMHTGFRSCNTESEIMDILEGEPAFIEACQKIAGSAEDEDDDI